MSTFIILLFVAFFLGSIPTGYLVGRALGIDIRKEGSGNTGATNAGRVLGKKAGVITLVADIAKGLLASSLPLIFSIGQLEWSTITDTDMGGIQSIYGLFAILGHCYSPFLNFKGGKGVATSLGVYLGINSLATLIMIVIFALVVKTTRFVSLSSIIAAISLPVLLFLEVGGVEHGMTRLIALVVAFLVVKRHKENISRLLAGEESKL